MQRVFVLGSAVQCSDGPGGAVSHLVINPNRTHLEYLIVQSLAPNQPSHYVPIGAITDASPAGITLDISIAELASKPLLETAPRVEATFESNIPDLCIASNRTPVKDEQGNLLGHFQGVQVEADSYQVTHLLVDTDRDAGIAVTKLDPAGKDELIVQFA